MIQVTVKDVVFMMETDDEAEAVTGVDAALSEIAIDWGTMEVS